jgi:hypothetical protein
MLIDARIEATRLRSGDLSANALLHSVEEPGARMTTRQTL